MKFEIPKKRSQIFFLEKERKTRLKDTCRIFEMSIIAIEMTKQDSRAQDTQRFKSEKIWILDFRFRFVDFVSLLLDSCLELRFYSLVFLCLFFFSGVFQVAVTRGNRNKWSNKNQKKAQSLTEDCCCFSVFSATISRTQLDYFWWKVEWARMMERNRIEEGVKQKNRCQRSKTLVTSRVQVEIPLQLDTFQNKTFKLTKQKNEDEVKMLVDILRWN